jgi:hypothetical protein
MDAEGWVHNCNVYAKYFYGRCSWWNRFYWTTTFTMGIVVAGCGFVQVKVDNATAQLVAGAVAVVAGFVIPFLAKLDASSRSTRDGVAGDQYKKLAFDFAEQTDAEQHKQLRALYNDYLVQYDEPPAELFQL